MKTCPRGTEIKRPGNPCYYTSFICVTDVATGKETHVSICNTAKVLVTKHGWHEYEEMIKRGRTASAAEIEGAQEESKRIRYEQVKATKQLWPHGHL